MLSPIPHLAMLFFRSSVLECQRLAFPSSLQVPLIVRNSCHDGLSFRPGTLPFFSASAFKSLAEKGRWQVETRIGDDSVLKSFVPNCDVRIIGGLVQCGKRGPVCFYPVPHLYYVLRLSGGFEYWSRCLKAGRLNLRSICVTPRDVDEDGKGYKHEDK